MFDTDDFRQVSVSRIKSLTVRIDTENNFDALCVLGAEFGRKEAIRQMAQAIAEKLFEFDKVLVVPRNDWTGKSSLVARIEVIVPDGKPHDLAGSSR